MEIEIDLPKLIIAVAKELGVQEAFVVWLLDGNTVYATVPVREEQNQIEGWNFEQQFSKKHKDTLIKVKKWVLLDTGFCGVVQIQPGKGVTYIPVNVYFRIDEGLVEFKLHAPFLELPFQKYDEGKGA